MHVKIQNINKTFYTVICKNLSNSNKLNKLRIAINTKFWHFIYSWSDSWDRHRPTLLTELNSNRNPRKVTDRIPRTIKSRLSKDPKSTESNDIEREIKTEGSPTKSCIPTARKLTTSTLTPRSARAVTSTGRSHNS